MPKLVNDAAFQRAVDHHRAGRLAEADVAYREILKGDPDQFRVWHALGLLRLKAGHAEAAAQAFNEAIRLEETFVAAHHALGLARMAQNQIEDALNAWRHAVHLDPEHAESHAQMAQALRHAGRVQEASAAEQAEARAHNGRGLALQASGKFGEAVTAFAKARELAPNQAEFANSLGCALGQLGQMDAAIDALRDAIRLDPEYAPAHNNLGIALRRVGQLDAAFASYRTALQHRPDYATAHSNLLFALHGHPDYDAQTLLSEHRSWARQHADRYSKTIQPHTNDPDSQRRLRVGYVSPDFWRHPVGFFLVPLFEAHDSQQVEVFCYSDASTEDTITNTLRAKADVWRDISALSDERVEQLVRNDGIDVLVDLAMHSANHRLLVFARKPAPVQVSYLAYCSTTGLDSMDFRLTDPHIDPPDAEQRYSEQSIRLPHSYWCYRPADDAVQGAAAPVLDNGYVTFGCLNEFAKLSSSCLSLWTELLRSVPESRLLLHAPEGKHRQRVAEVLGRAGIKADRLSFVSKLPMRQYLELYARIDIGLDPFPYGGGITTCDALWMGVPVVSLVGRTGVGRGGASILANVGLPELLAHGEAEYLQIAEGLCKDLDRLTSLRGNLRQRMQASPLMDSHGFARAVESAYREMWGKWCAANRS